MPFWLQTKYDFTMMGAGLLCVLMAFNMFIIMSWFWCGWGSGCPVLNVVIACAGALLFSVYLVYDTQVTHLQPPRLLPA